jgi:hypothetical protein
VVAVCVTVATLVEVTVIVVKLTTVEVVLSVPYEVIVSVPTTLAVDVAVMDWVEVGVIVLSSVSRRAIVRRMEVLRSRLGSDCDRNRCSLRKSASAG